MLTDHDVATGLHFNTYIVAPWWQPPTINIPNSKEKATQLHNQCLASKPPLKIVAYTDGSGINEKSALLVWFKESLRLSKSFWSTHLQQSIHGRTARYTRRSQLRSKSEPELRSPNLRRQPSSAASPRKPQWLLRTADYAENHAAHRWSKSQGYPNSPPLDTCSYGYCS